MEAERHLRYEQRGSMSELYLPLPHPQNLIHIVRKSLSVNGFIVFRLLSKYEDEFYATVPPKLVRGELKYREDITSGLENVGDVILGVQKGTNNGKAIISVAQE